MLVAVSDLTLKSSSSSILEGVSLSVMENDFITIIGPNGAGKSTLLKCIVGISSATSGTIKKRDGLKIGYVPQSLNTASYIPIKVSEFLSLRCPNDRLFFNRIVDEISIRHLLDNQVFSISGGELRKVLVARALLLRPHILIMDEPAQNLDVAGQLFFYNFLEKIYYELGISILMVSHDLHFVMSCTKNVICLFKHVCCTGEPKIVSQDPRFISLFGNDLAKITAVYNHTHDHKH